MLSRIINFLLMAGSISTTAQASNQLVYMQEYDNIKRIMLVDEHSNQPRNISGDATWALYPDISADGRYVAYSSGHDQNHLGIKIKDLKHNITEEWVTPEGAHLHSSLSGDATMLAFVRLDDKGSAVGIIDLASERRKGASEISDTVIRYEPEIRWLAATSDFFPNLSSTGTFLVTQRNQNGQKYLVKTDLLSGEETIITDINGFVMSPDLSFDDQEVVYTRKTGTQWQIVKTQLGKNVHTTLTNTDAKDFAPNFKADGSVIFASDRSGSFALYELSVSPNANGEYATKLLQSGHGDLYAPSISGDLTYTLEQYQSIPEPGRSSFGAIAHQNKIYVAGGHIGPEHTYPPESFSARLDIYDIASKTWYNAADLSLPRHGFSLAAHGKYVYAFGGFTYSDQHYPRWKSVDLIERYDTELDRWEVVGHLPRARSSNIAAKIGNRVYLMGGWDSTPKSRGDLEGTFHHAIDVYDLETNTVSTLSTTLPDPLRRALSAVVHQDEIILIGGIGVGASHFDLLDTVTAFNVKTETWRELPKLPFATFAPATGILGQKLFVFGGMFKTGPMAYEYVNHIYELSLGAARWTHTGRYLMESKGFSQVVNLDSATLGVLGGHTYEGDIDHPVASFEVFKEKD